MKVIHEYDHVVLADGREGAVVEINGDQESFDIDIGTTPESWMTLYSVPRSDIARVVTAEELEEKAV